MLCIGKLKPNATQFIALGFAVIILLGALMLSLPFAARDGQPTPFVDALFTAASATCVTGLVVYDTYVHFSMAGQLIILLLIQVGGLGFMSMASLCMLVAGKRIGLRERSLLMESINTTQIGGIVRLMRHILVGTLIFEGVGALLLSIRFCAQFGLWQGMYFGIFHSVSAFCNAGFDLMGCVEPYSSLMSYRADALVNITVMLLIIIGGLGFIVWEDLYTKRLRFSRYRLHTKLVLTTTLALIIGGAVLFYLSERDGVLNGLGTGEIVLSSLFQSVSPRTAGYNTLDIAAYSTNGSVLTIFLMFVGGSPGSTAGGLKTTTLMVMLLTLLASVRHRDELNAFGRRLEDGVARRAYSIATIYLLSAGLAYYLIMHLQDGLSPGELLFEVFSAIGTVGLSTGITRELEPPARIIIAFLMYCGRVGSLSVLMAVTQHGSTPTIKLPTEKITIG